MEAGCQASTFPASTFDALVSVYSCATRRRGWTPLAAVAAACAERSSVSWLPRTTCSRRSLMKGAAPRRLKNTCGASPAAARGPTAPPNCAHRRSSNRERTSFNQLPPLPITYHFSNTYSSYLLEACSPSPSPIPSLIPTLLFVGGLCCKSRTETQSTHPSTSHTAPSQTDTARCCYFFEGMGVCFFRRWTRGPNPGPHETIKIAFSAFSFAQILLRNNTDHLNVTYNTAWPGGRPGRRRR